MKSAVIMRPTVRERIVAPRGRASMEERSFAQPREWPFILTCYRPRQISGQPSLCSKLAEQTFRSTRAFDLLLLTPRLITVQFMVIVGLVVLLRQQQNDLEKLQSFRGAPRAHALKLFRLHRICP